MEYRLLGYEAIPFADSREYHPPGLRNPLQIGAEVRLDVFSFSTNTSTCAFLG